MELYHKPFEFKKKRSSLSITALLS